MKVSADKPSVATNTFDGKQLDGASSAPRDMVDASDVLPKESTEKREDVEKAVNKLNKTAEIYNHEVKFVIHDKTHRIMVQIVDKQTDEIISELPPKKIIDMVVALQEMVGLLVDKKA